MSIYKITFSPTGGTQKVADLLMAELTREAIPVDLSAAVDFHTFCFTAEDICIVSVPSFGGRVPAVAIARLKQMTCNGARAVLVAVYGNRAYEDTLRELCDTLTDIGFCCIAAVAAVAEHSILHQFAAGRPDANDCRELIAFAGKIRAKIEAHAAPQALVLPGNFPYREYGGVPMKPKADKTCTKCGLCAAKCPVGAISTENPAKTDAAACISCMRCVEICPAKARSVSSVVLAVAATKMKKTCSEHQKNELFL